MAKLVRVCKACGEAVAGNKRGEYFHTGVPVYLATLARETELTDIGRVKVRNAAKPAHPDIPFVPVRVETVHHQHPGLAVEADQPPTVRPDITTGGSGTGRDNPLLPGIPEGPDPLPEGPGREEDRLPPDETPDGGEPCSTI